VSGLPEPTLEERASLATAWQRRGFDSFKYAAPIAYSGIVEEMQALRRELGPHNRIAVDLHWKHSVEDAVQLINKLEALNPWFVEAPKIPEDTAGLAKIIERTNVPIAVGKEWRTVYDMRRCLEFCRIDVVQPKMGHSGITNFVRMGECAVEHGIEFIPHATIGMGLFLAASVVASSTLTAVAAHECQHSVFDPDRGWIRSELACLKGEYVVPSDEGIGAEPSDWTLDMLERL